MDKINSVIAKNIKKYRKLHKMTQKQLAELVGVSIAAVSNWETGSNSIDIDTLFNVCHALHVPISVIAEEHDAYDLSDIEKELLMKFRNASDWQKLTVINTLNLENYPAHLEAYANLLQKYMRDR